VALSRARELGFNTVACASTGNLAQPVAENSPPPDSSLRSSFRPISNRQVVNSLVYGAEVIGIKGHYDEVKPALRGNCRQIRLGNSLMSTAAYYAEGSKSWALKLSSSSAGVSRKHTVVPMASVPCHQTQKSYRVRQSWPGGRIETSRPRRAGDRLRSHFPPRKAGT